MLVYEILELRRIFYLSKCQCSQKQWKGYTYSITRHYNVSYLKNIFRI